MIYTIEKPLTIEGQIVTVNSPVPSLSEEPIRVVPISPKPVVPVAPHPIHSQVFVQPITPVKSVVPVVNPFPVKPLFPGQTVIPVKPVVVPAKPFAPSVVAKPFVPIEVPVKPKVPSYDSPFITYTTTNRPLFGDANKISTPGPAYLPSFTDPKPQVKGFGFF